ncbi:MAG TPA: FAD-dependent monooxygenase, partial [Solirubrobacterales bacterium]|nr:FAD-dependent monooxygenase [Solirubrobacterales bacterium]
MHAQISHPQVPVLIVGGGPAGLVTAITLARYGIRSLLVERRRELSDEPRATAVSTRSMELLRSWGLESAMREGEVDATLRGRMGETLTGRGEEIPLGYPTPEEAAAFSPTAPIVAPQDYLEPLLLDHLRGFGEAEIRFGTEVLDVAVGEAGVLAQIRLVDGGPVETIGARYLVGADGVRSRVRDALGIGMTGPGAVADAASVLFDAPLWDYVERPGYGIYPVTRPIEGVFVASSNGERWTYGIRADVGRLPAWTFDEAVMARCIRDASGIPELQPRIRRIRKFQYVAGVAERFRAGSAFLAGDAAHRVTPRGGTGMNTAIRNSFDLGWKLAWVLRGWAGESLLDTYESERRPIAEHNVARSVDPNGSVRPPGEELRVDLGGRIAHHWLEGEEGRRSTIDLVGSGLTLLTRRGNGGAGASALLGSGPLVELHEL